MSKPFVLQTVTVSGAGIGRSQRTSVSPATFACWEASKSAIAATTEHSFPYGGIPEDEKPICSIPGSLFINHDKTNTENLTKKKTQGLTHSPEVAEGKFLGR